MIEPQSAPSRRPVLLIAGPTASGKSALALEAAEALGGTIINADSMQVYRELRILTARPSPAEEVRVPHRLYGVLPAREPCSAARWRAMALAAIAEAQSAGRLPVVVGGTGLYLRALQRGLAPVPEVPAEVRRRARERHAHHGGAALHGELARRDPRMAARLAPGDSQRLVRAWEVLEATGRSLAEWQSEASEAAPPELAFHTVLLLPAKAEVDAAVDTRFVRMLEAGATCEVRRLLALDLDPALPVMRAVGVPELAGYLRGEISLEAAVARAQQRSRQLAKRQLTWFRHQTPKDDPGAFVVRAQYSQRLWPQIFNNIRAFVLTAQP